MLSDRMFQRILHLNDRELYPYEGVLAFGIWRRFLSLKSGLVSLVVKKSDITGG